RTAEPIAISRIRHGPITPRSRTVIAVIACLLTYADGWVLPRKPSWATTSSSDRASLLCTLKSGPFHCTGKTPARFHDRMRVPSEARAVMAPVQRLSLLPDEAKPSPDVLFSQSKRLSDLTSP